jgi:DNA-binding NarL/FixJ family response regulator
MNGLIAAERLIKRHPGVLILFITAYLDRAYIEEASRLGARGCVLKSRLTEVEGAIRAVLSGQTYFPS